MCQSYNKQIFFVFTALLVLCLSGCATTPTIGYKADSARQAAKNVNVTVKPFSDSRISREQSVLGGVYNGYGMRLGDVHEPKGLIKSLEDAFRQELANDGYAIIDNSKDIVIEGPLNLFPARSPTGKNLHF